MSEHQQRVSKLSNCPIISGQPFIQGAITISFNTTHEQKPAWPPHRGLQYCASNESRIEHDSKPEYQRDLYNPATNHTISSKASPSTSESCYTQLPTSRGFQAPRKPYPAITPTQVQAKQPAISPHTVSSTDHGSSRPCNSAEQVRNHTVTSIYSTLTSLQLSTSRGFQAYQLLQPHPVSSTTTRYQPAHGFKQ